MSESMKRTVVEVREREREREGPMSYCKYKIEKIHMNHPKESERERELN